MGRGYFPLYRNDENGEKLLQAAQLIKEVTDSIYEDIYSGADGQFDNAASDGGSLARLDLARSLVISEVEKEKPKVQVTP